MTITARAYFLESFGEPLRAGELVIEAPATHEAIVQVEACGMCHTDLGYANGSVKPNHALPLVLGHEVMGRVVDAGAAFQSVVGKRVIVPAVLPCMVCEFCTSGRSNACPQQKMPGNDVHGGFATHLKVPAAPLVDLSEAPEGFDLRALSTVADAVSTAYQAVVRSGLQAGDVAFVIGAGGVGGFTAQIAAALGAHVVAFDVSDARLEAIKSHGAEATINVKDQEVRDLRKQAWGLAKQWGVQSLRFRILECSGTGAGQDLAYTLIGRASTVVFVGYTIDKLSIRLSNLMAFDATAHGTWGCPPDAYRDVLRLIFDGKVSVDPFVAYAPLDTVSEQLDAMAAHKLTKRVVLVP